MEKHRVMTLCAGALLAFCGVPAAAEPTDIAVAPGQSWTHSHSGIMLPATLIRIPRLNAKLFTGPELDVSFGYGAPGTDVITFFISRDTNGSVPIWIAQAERSILLRDDMTNAILAFPSAAFTPPGQATNSGLKTIFVTKGNPQITSTGVAMFALGGWYVKMRATSFSKTPAQLSAFMDAALREIRLPRPSQPAAAVRPIAGCANKLSFGNAVAVKNPGTVGVKQAAPTMRAANWCLEQRLEGNTAVYRPVGTSDRFLMAVGDNGNGLVVQPHSGYYSENFFTAGKTYTLTPMDRMPAPQRARGLIDDNAMVEVLTSWPPR